ncbi:MAG TPA: DUF6194 family protein [Microlunatus sp.]|nr:DUF6194 family protein [Microlunatus sp.]
MTLEEIVGLVERWEGVLVLRPGEGDGTPPIAWGDVFFFYAPDGAVPATQPFATIVTKDYPDDASGRLDRPGAFRVNAGVGRQEYMARTGQHPREPAPAAPPVQVADDVLLPHPVYRSQGWLAVVNPGSRTSAVLVDLLRIAYDGARARWIRRGHPVDG